MVKQELFDRSPIRLFDKVTDGGLKPGEIGLVTSKKGLGKTSVLVQFGMDTLLCNKQMVHVTFDQHSENVISWYSGIFTEIAKKKNLGNITEMMDSIMRNRTILNFNQDTLSLAKVVDTLKALTSAGIDIAGIIIDGLDLAKVTEADMSAVSDYAKSAKVTVWMSATAEGDKPEDSAPKNLLPYFTGILHLSPKPDGVQVSVIRLRNSDDIKASLKLDSKTLLITDR